MSTSPNTYAKQGNIQNIIFHLILTHINLMFLADLLINAPARYTCRHANINR